MLVRALFSALIISSVVFNFFLPEAEAEAEAGTRESHLKFESGWIRVTSSGHPMTAGYITISNNGSKDVVLMSVSSTVAKM